MSDKFDYLNFLIKDLSKNDRYVVLVFLLKAQHVEYGLKYLLGWYPYKPDNYYRDGFLDRATMGQIIKKIKDLNDSYLLEITDEAEKFLVIQNEVAHHLLTSGKSIIEIENECREKIIIADKIEMKVHFLMDYVDDLIYGSFY